MLPLLLTVLLANDAPLGPSFALGLDSPDCSDHGCQVLDGTFGMGLGGSNYGGFGVGVDVDGRWLAAWPSKIGTKAEIQAFGHFNGVGMNYPTDRPPQGELGAMGKVGFGLLTPAALRGALRPFVLVNPIGFRLGTFDGGDFWGYLPTVEVGLLAHARTRDTLIVEVAGGGDLFWADGPLSRLGTNGLAHAAADPYASAEVVFDLALSTHNTLRVAGEGGFTPDDLGAFGSRDVWWGRATVFFKLGPLVSGPVVTFAAAERQPLGATYVGAPPESSFLWVFGL